MLTRLFRERRRSHAVRSVTGGDEAIDMALNRYTGAAQQAFGAPIAALSLIHDDTQAIRAARGVEVGCHPRRLGFCTVALQVSDVLECCDALVDPRFSGLPAVVGAPFIRYYIGVPLRLMSGIEIGVLCIADIVTRIAASPDQKAYLIGLARQASVMLEGQGPRRRRTA